MFLKLDFIVFKISFFEVFYRDMVIIVKVVMMVLLFGLRVFDLVCIVNFIMVNCFFYDN